MAKDEVKELKEQNEKLAKENAALDAANKKLVVAAEENGKLQQEKAMLKAEIEELKRALFEEAAGKAAHVEITEGRPSFTDEELDLIEDACAAYKIEAEHVVNVRIEEGAAVVVTAGGSKVRYFRGDEKKEGFSPLNQVQVTGINPEAKKRKPIAGRGSKLGEE